LRSATASGRLLVAGCYRAWSALGGTPRPGDTIRTVVADAFPLVTAALICERVLVEKDEVVSAIRVFDRVLYQVPPPPAKPAVVAVYFVALKRGEAAEDAYDLRVIVRSPSGKEVEPTKETPIKAQFPTRDPDAGVNLQIQFAISPSEEGLFWVELLINDSVRARTPLRMIPMRGD
jgi:uncharacterized protein DUF6941